MKLILNGKKILELSGLPNAHQVSMKAAVSYSTINKYINMPDEVEALDSNVLARLLIDGCGIDPEQLMQMPIGEIFALVEGQD